MKHSFGHIMVTGMVKPLPTTGMVERNGLDRRDNIAFTWGVPNM